MDPDESQLADGSQLLHHLLWEVSGQVALIAKGAFDGTSLTPALNGILDQIAAEPGTTIARISRRVPSSPQSVRQVVERLERLAFIDRRVDGGRGIGLYVTDLGAEARERGQRLEVRLDKQLRSYLPERAYTDLVELLQQTCSNFAQPVADARSPRQRST